MVSLFDDQGELVDNIKKSIQAGNRALIVCAPTGSGKTVIFSYLINKLLKNGKKVLFLTHRKELLKQTIKTVGRLRHDCFFLAEMIETHYNKVKKRGVAKLVDYIIVDEAHISSFDKVLKKYIECNGNVVILGFTATPLRGGSQSPLSDIYTDIVYGLDIPQLVDLERLAPCESYSTEIDLTKHKIVDGDIDTTSIYHDNKVFEKLKMDYKTLVNIECNKDFRGKLIVFCSSIKSAKEVHDSFLADKGLTNNIYYVDSTMPQNYVDDVIHRYKHDPMGIMVNCSMLTTGFDCTDIEIIALYRATISLSLFLQMCGRGSRVCLGKKKFIVLDYGNNITRFGLWDAPRQWSLDKKNKAENIISTNRCESCGFFNYKNASDCVKCGYIFTDKEINKSDKEKECISITFEDARLLLKKVKKIREINDIVSGVICEKEIEELIKSFISENRHIKFKMLLSNLEKKHVGLVPILIKAYAYKSGYYKYIDKNKYKCFN